jgi:hypothetical protein
VHLAPRRLFVALQNDGAMRYELNDPWISVRRFRTNLAFAGTLDKQLVCVA